MRVGPDKLTDRQAAILDFIIQSLSDRGFPPTVAEIATAFKFSSPNAASSHLNALRKKAYIKLTPRVSRGIEVLRSPGGAHQPPAFAPGVPIVGRVAAGSPVLAQANAEGSVALDANAFARRPDYFLRVQGDSMVDAGIFEGDLVAVHRTSEVRTGEIVVARVNDDVTVKTYRKKGRKIELEPANSRYKPIMVDPANDRFELEGVCVGLLRAM